MKELSVTWSVYLQLAVRERVSAAGWLAVDSRAALPVGADDRGRAGALCSRNPAPGLQHPIHEIKA
jgi:hypothetical protein